MRKAARASLIVLALLLGSCLVVGLIVDAPLPEGDEGPEADALARRIETAVGRDAWEDTGAVQWTFAGWNHHLWDRRRGYARVRWGSKEVLLRLADQSGRVTRDGEEIAGEDARAIREEAYARFINDSFWLNPLVKLFDPGVRRSLVRVRGGETGLLITYTQGGLTPGDSYLWLLGDDDRPRAVRMWVSVIPIGGFEVPWEGWKTLDTGARVATDHPGPLDLYTLRLGEVRGASTLEGLTGPEDPFAPLE